MVCSFGPASGLLFFIVAKFFKIFLKTLRAPGDQGLRKKSQNIRNKAGNQGFMRL
jgi:hypothetical protein